MSRGTVMNSGKVSGYLGATFAFTWVLQTPGILAMRAGCSPTSGQLLMMGLGSAGPTLVALAFALGERLSGRPVARPTRKEPFPVWVAVVALAIPVGAHLLGSGALRVFGIYDAAHWFYPPLLGTEIAIAIVAPLGEEFGWRGYALPRLQNQMSPLAASLWVGLVWALWHVPTFFVPEARGVTPVELVLYLVAYLASSVIYTWLYNRGGRSVWGPVLAHLGVHLDNVFRASKMGDGVQPLASTTVVLTILAIALFVRGQLRSNACVA